MKGTPKRKYKHLLPAKRINTDWDGEWIAPKPDKGLINLVEKLLNEGCSKLHQFLKHDDLQLIGKDDSIRLYLLEEALKDLEHKHKAVKVSNGIIEAWYPPGEKTKVCYGA